MFGFLFKVILIAAVVAGAGYYITTAKSKGTLVMPDFRDPGQLLSQVLKLDTGQLGNQVSAALDSLVTKPAKSPFVMGLEVTNTSLEAIVDSIYNLPSDQLSQVRNIICEPSTASTASGIN